MTSEIKWKQLEFKIKEEFRNLETAKLRRKCQEMILNSEAWELKVMHSYQNKDLELLQQISELLPKMPKANKAQKI